MDCCHYRKVVISLFLVLFPLGFVATSNLVFAHEPHYLSSGLHIQSHETDLDFEDEIRETRFTSLDIVVREKLAPRITGTITLGLLWAYQKTNPIFAGQDTAGGYLGLGLGFLIAHSPSYELYSNLEYRYSYTDASDGDQTVEWGWHQGTFTLHNEFYISDSLSISLAASAHAIDGRQKATGDINQNIDFKGEDSLSGNVGLKINLDQAGQIGIQLQVGSLQGGRLVFERYF